MTPERWRQVTRIYGAVMTKSPDGREAALAELCHDDEELRKEVESLLRDDSGNALLDRPVGDVAGSIVAQDFRGRTLGPYRLETAIGAGGMGEVYRATDTRLHRTVAVKLLAPSLAHDPQFRARFDREAKSIASLNHPHICTLYDVGSTDGIDYLVMEYVEGETLASRLEHGALPLNQALTTATQIAEALAAAHRQGLVHRDLKPGNVMLTKSGVKLLDFGLAKPQAGAGEAGWAGGVSMLPTTPPVGPTNAAPLTAQGTILGTLQYMAPEQLEGKDADARTDIFAFGAIVYEMVSGKKAFSGSSQASLIGAIMHAEPSSLQATQPLTPPALDRLIRTCLAKDPDERWQSVRDLARELKQIASSSELAAPAIAPAASRRRWIVWSTVSAIAALIAGASVIVLRGRTTSTAAANLEFVVLPPDGAAFGGPLGAGSGGVPQVALAPDGRTLVFVANKDGYALWLRRFESAAPIRLEGTEGAAYPFWSPDSRFIGFFAQGKLKRVAVTGGPVLEICDAQNGRGGSWNQQNVIIFGPSTTGAVKRVNASEGVPSDVTKLDDGYGEIGHRFPQFLPDGNHFVFTAVTGAGSLATRPSRIKVASLEGGDSKELLQAESSAVYAFGRLLYLAASPSVRAFGGATLMAHPFDVVTLRFTGDPTAVAQSVASEPTRYGAFSAAATGALVVADRVGGAITEFEWFDRGGRSLGTTGPKGSFPTMTLSPNDRYLAVTNNGWPSRTIQVIDLTTGIEQPVTFDGSDASTPIWSPDGSHLVLSVFDGADKGLQIVSAFGGAVQARVLLKADTFVPIPTDWSRDGSTIVFQQNSPPGGGALWSVSVADGTPAQLTHPRFNDDAGVLSPDGRWLAYSSNGGAQIGYQVYVRELATGMARQVSRSGGSQPLWNSNGHELFFLAADGSLMSVRLRTSPSFEAETPQRLFGTRVPNPVGRRNYAVTREGDRFLVTQLAGKPLTSPLTVRTNWLAGLAP